MNFDLPRSLEILERTPTVLDLMLRDLSPFWTDQNEGPDTWSPYDVIGHLIHCDKADWITRTEIIMSDRENKTFPPVDRFAQFAESEGKSLADLLAEFKTLRAECLAKLKSYRLTEDELRKTGIHPMFGEVTLAQLLSTWTVHDLDHISQISRVMAKQYREDVGPWLQYLKILRS